MVTITTGVAELEKLCASLSVSLEMMGVVAFKAETMPVKITKEKYIVRTIPDGAITWVKEPTTEAFKAGDISPALQAEIEGWGKMMSVTASAWEGGRVAQFWENQVLPEGGLFTLVRISYNGRRRNVALIGDYTQMVNQLAKTAKWLRSSAAEE